MSRQHRILIRSGIARQIFDTSEVLVAAIHLLPVEGVEIVDDLDEVVYCHMLFDRHEIVMSNGAETESLYTGSEVLKRVGSDALTEIYMLFPQLRDHHHVPVAARRFLAVPDIRRLLNYHGNNRAHLVST